MFELFMMCLFAVIGMLLGNLVFNILIAASYFIENDIAVEPTRDKFKRRIAMLTSDTVKNANQIIRDRKNLLTPAETKVLEITKDKNIDINFGVKKACEVLKEHGIFEK